MSSPTAPIVDCDLLVPVLPVSDIIEAVDFYTHKLGFSPGFTWGEPPEYAGVNLGNISIHLSTHTGKPGGATVNFVVGDADELFAFHQRNGVEILESPGDREYGLRDYGIRDLYGNVLNFGHYIYNMEPPIKIERVEVPLRLEKRLAALLKDLAEHKRMNLDSMMEETLLHTFEPFGDSVASPHTKATLRYIQELKKKHGIDYDTHASYRFVE